MAATYPSIFSLPHLQAPSDGVYTDTLEDQRDTEEVIAQALTSQPQAVVPGRPTDPAAADPTVLRKSEHTSFLASNFFKLPSGFVGLDASKPWLVFWTVHSLDLLGVALDQDTKDRAVSTVLAYLSPKGGFAGGASNSHEPHLLPTYAAVCALAICGGPGSKGGWKELADARQGMYDFFMSCKRPDGGFVVCPGGEIDVRGIYCLLTVATLLDILTPELVHNVDRFIAACQTFEGGFACAAYTFGANPALDTAPRAAMAEAHGGYTSCSLASHFLLSSIIPPSTDTPLTSLPAGFPVQIDVPSAVRWSVLMQGEAGEAGGFRGRSNKLVDGCYGWWVGGTFPVLEELNRREHEARASVSTTESRFAVVEDEGDADVSGDWEDEQSMSTLFNRVALQEYVLLAAQREAGGAGGLRDKPEKRPDLYHTCNNLSGLSVAQHKLVHSEKAISELRDSFDANKGLPRVKTRTPEGDWKNDKERAAARKAAYANILGWEEVEDEEFIVGGAESRVNTTVPVVNILGLRLKPFVKYFYGQ